MLSRKVAASGALAITAGLVSALTHAAALLGQSYHPANPWSAWSEAFSLAAFAAGISAAVAAYRNSPTKPPGWRDARPFAFWRLAPAGLYLGFVTLSWILYKSASPELAQLLWKAVSGTVSQFVFALLVWENLWTWRAFTPGLP
jgi:hypothetical protein